MQSRAIRRLARKLRSTHRNTKSWPETARLCHIIKENGDPSEGLAYRIAVEGYEPKTHQTLVRIGMPCFCDQCKKQKRQAASLKRIAHLSLIDMPVDALRNALINRKPMPPITYKKCEMNYFIKACKAGRAS